MVRHDGDVRGGGTAPQVRLRAVGQVGQQLHPVHGPRAPSPGEPSHPPEPPEPDDAAAGPRRRVGALLSGVLVLAAVVLGAQAATRPQAPTPAARPDREAVATPRPTTVPRGQGLDIQLLPGLATIPAPSPEGIQRVGASLPPTGPGAAGDPTEQEAKAAATLLAGAFCRIPAAVSYELYPSPTVSYAQVTLALRGSQEAQGVSFDLIWSHDHYDWTTDPRRAYACDDVRAQPSVDPGLVAANPTATGDGTNGD